MTTTEPNDSASPARAHSRATALKFLIPSLLGILLFLVPVEVKGITKVLLGVIADWLVAAAGTHVEPLCALIFVTLFPVKRSWTTEWFSLRDTLRGQRPWGESRYDAIKEAVDRSSREGDSPEDPPEVRS